MKRKHTGLAILGVVAALLVGSMSLGRAWAYFTDTTSATGGIAIKVAPSTDISETFGAGAKHVVITNDEDSVPVYVRVRVDANAESLGGVSGTGWADGGDGWWYYGIVVDPAGATDELQVGITFPTGTTTTITGPDGTTTTQQVPPEGGENIRVSVYYQAVPVAGYTSAQAAFAGFAASANAS